MKSGDVKCPITKVALLLSDAWTMLVMHFLIEGPKRFCELEKLLSGISTRTLTLKLNKLIEDGMVSKNADGAYLATKKGKGLRVIEDSMRKYEKKYL